ncbi:MAG TPA: cupin domain-containing protein, partial [Rheinheimera sp.]|nr:cupin domain-containing protein [Rheinheimera sp.]
MDRLSTLLAQFGMHASTFHSGAFSGSSEFAAPQRGGTLHLLGSGRLSLQAGQCDVLLTEPSLIFMPRPTQHTLLAHPADKTQLVSAYLGFDGGQDNPLTTALPDCLIMPVRQLPTLHSGLAWLFAESAEQNCGRNAVLNRLIELIMIQLLRHVMNNHIVSSGMMAGL